ncbi:MAG: DNA phosphorothioation-associated protein 4 [Burkholderiaceae bacterium]|nr:MAG: DNA phosphorothioation-associated protein 4 [Burkholderiaceae bacterium]
MSNDVRRPKQYEEMLSDLCQSDKKIFLSYKDALVFAACLGYAKSRTTPFDKTSESVGMHIFKGEFDESVFQCIGLCETKDPAIMSDENHNKRIKLFEEYAAGGLEVMKSRIYDGPEDWDSALVGLIIEFESEEKNILDDITNIAG